MLELQRLRHVDRVEALIIKGSEKPSVVRGRPSRIWPAHSVDLTQRPPDPNGQLSQQSTVTCCLYTEGDGYPADPLMASRTKNLSPW
jgi:hypothetical protein